MFELLSDVAALPLDAGSLKRVHTGMNKVRISVGEHVSEPSEAYIATGVTEGGYETYVVFYMIEPGINVFYGHDRNPYDPGEAEEVIGEAVDFVEEIGSILEEVPWETMTPEQRAAWAEKETLFGTAETGGPEIIAVAEPVESVELIEVLEDAETDVEVEAARAEVLETADEGRDGGLVVDQAGADADEEISEEIETGTLEEEDETGPASASEPDVVVADGDFDELLKQAFLKPDVARKTGRSGKTAPVEEPQVQEKDQQEDVERFEIEIEEEAAEPPVEEPMVEEEPVLPEDGSTPPPPEPAVIQAPPATSSPPGSAGGERPLPDDRKTILNVVRFLSRF